MKKFLIVLAIIILLPLKFSFAEEGPATYFMSVSGTTETGGDFDLSDLTGTFKIGLKTDLAGDGDYHLLTTYRQVNVGPLADDVKSLDVGVEKRYALGMKAGFFTNSYLAIRASSQFELNQESNNVNAVLGMAWEKKLAVDANGNAVFSIEPFMDFTAKEDRDFFTVGFSINITPPVQ